MTTHITAEFTIEPFEPSAPGPHVRAAIELAEASAVDHPITVDVGPFGTTISGPATDVLHVVAAVNDAAIHNGATRVSLQLTVSHG